MTHLDEHLELRSTVTAIVQGAGEGHPHLQVLWEQGHALHAYTFETVGQFAGLTW